MIFDIFFIFSFHQFSFLQNKLYFIVQDFLLIKIIYMIHIHIREAQFVTVFQKLKLFYSLNQFME